MAKGDKDFYFETLCKYKNNDGSVGVILQVKEKKNEKIQGIKKEYIANTGVMDGMPDLNFLSS